MNLGCVRHNLMLHANIETSLERGIWWLKASILSQYTHTACPIKIKSKYFFKTRAQPNPTKNLSDWMYWTLDMARFQVYFFFLIYISNLNIV